MKKKAIVVTPRFPFFGFGACEQDRSAGVRQLVRLGYEVVVIVKVLPSDLLKVEEAEKSFGIRIIPVMYTKHLPQSRGERFRRFIKRIGNPLFWDGAAFEYTDPKIQNALENEMKGERPAFTWFDYTYLWPLYAIAKKYKVPIITRSINIEAFHFLQEDGVTLLNVLKFVPKYVSEVITSRYSDILFAITPKEARWYRAFARRVEVLPLRGLPEVLNTAYVIRKQKPLHVFFAGSTYNVVHNRKAIEMVLLTLVPELGERFPNTFVIHIFGGKLPDHLLKLTDGATVIYEGRRSVEEFNQLMQVMDIALVPSLLGAGMQQKIFEPLCRGIPTVASPRGIAEYDFRDKVHYLAASSEAAFLEALLLLQNEKLRKTLSDNAREQGKRLFSSETLDAIVRESLLKVL